MTGFVIIFALLVLITLLIQLITKMKIVGADELAIVAGQGKSFSSVRGGRVFVFPLIHRFYRMDMRPRTTSVRGGVGDRRRHRAAHRGGHGQFRGGRHRRRGCATRFAASC